MRCQAKVRLSIPKRIVALSSKHVMLIFSFFPQGSSRLHQERCTREHFLTGSFTVRQQFVNVFFVTDSMGLLCKCGVSMVDLCRVGVICMGGWGNLSGRLERKQDARERAIRGQRRSSMERSVPQRKILQWEELHNPPMKVQGAGGILMKILSSRIRTKSGGACSIGTRKGVSGSGSPRDRNGVENGGRKDATFLRPQRWHPWHMA